MGLAVEVGHMSLSLERNTKTNVSDIGTRHARNQLQDIMSVQAHFNVTFLYDIQRNYFMVFILAVKSTFFLKSENVLEIDYDPPPDVNVSGEDDREEKPNVQEEVFEGS